MLEQASQDLVQVIDGQGYFGPMALSPGISSRQAWTAAATSRAA
ncbi:MAG: hypothetical protein ACKVZ6_02055 [Kineosporiaceae bacterium]